MRFQGAPRCGALLVLGAGWLAGTVIVAHPPPVLPRKGGGVLIQSLVTGLGLGFHYQPLSGAVGGVGGLVEGGLVFELLLAGVEEEVALIVGIH